MYEYKISVLVSDIEKILRETRQDSKNPNNSMLVGDYMPIFNKEISKAENEPRKIIQKNSNTVDQTNGAVLLSELTTSLQDVSQITSFFYKTKFDYEKNNKDRFRFRMIVTDMCWGLVNSIIDVLNRETVIEYSKSGFELASGKLTINQTNSKSWLTSCAAHTMKRFSKSLQKLKFDQFKHRYVCYAFRTLLNSKSLDTISENFKIVCDISIKISVKTIHRSSSSRQI